MADETGKTPGAGDTTPPDGAPKPDANTAPKDAAPAAGAATSPKFDPKLVDAELSRGVRDELKHDKKYGDAAYEAAVKGKNAAEVEAINKKFNDADAARDEVIEKRIKSVAGEKDAKAFEAALGTRGKEIGEHMVDVVPKLDFITKAVAHFSDNAGIYAIGGAIAALAAKLFVPSKETEKPDGTKEKHTGFLKGALITVGSIVTLGAVAEIFGPGNTLKRWASKIAGERHVAAAMKLKGGSPGATPG